jgi:hypothetical protein
MEFIDTQIKLYENLVTLYTNYIQSLKELKKVKELKKLKEKQLFQNDDAFPQEDDSYSTENMINSDQDLIWLRMQQARAEQVLRHPQEPIARETHTIEPSKEKPCVEKNPTEKTIAEKLYVEKTLAEKKCIKENNVAMPEFPQQVRNSPIYEAPASLKIHTSSTTQQTNSASPPAPLNEAHLDAYPEKKTDANETKKDDNFAPLITRLSKYPQKKQNEIIKNIFLKAKENIERLAAIDQNIKNNLETEINAEADRLLAAYLANG